ncbi:MAG: SH3 domain-containing protein [Candidatus Omnitrophota bacterium]
MNAKIKTVFILFMVFFLLPALQPSSGGAAVVITKYGPREGRAIVREFDRIVVTILTPDKRLFQYYARDVMEVTAAGKVLIGRKTPLRSRPLDDADRLENLCNGLEIKILESPADSEWVKIACWGNLEGWIRRDVLVDRTKFAEAEKKDSLTAAGAINNATLSAVAESLSASEAIDAGSTDSSKNEATGKEQPKN